MQYHCKDCGTYFVAEKHSADCRYCSSKNTEEVENIEIKPGFQVEKFKIIEQIGEGAKSQVFKCVDTLSKTDVVLKLPKNVFNNDPSYKTRFQSEAKILESIEHKNVLRLHATLEVNENLALITEFINGSDLNQLLLLEGSLPLAKTIDFLIQAAEGLEIVHKKGILHRDVKPHNFLVTNDGILKVADFGLAKPRDLEITKQNDAVKKFHGTPAYAAPEQIQGIEPTIKCDIYSFGITAYHLCTGRLPFETGTVDAILFEHVNTKIQSPRLINPAIPHSLDTLITEMCAKGPNSRPANMAEIRERLIQAQNELKNRKTEINDKKPKKTVNHTYIFAAFFIVFVAVIASFVLDYYEKLKERKGDIQNATIDMDYVGILQNSHDIDLPANLKVFTNLSGEIFAYSERKIFKIPSDKAENSQNLKESDLKLLAEVPESAKNNLLENCVSVQITISERFIAIQYPQNTVIAEIVDSKIEPMITLPETVYAKLLASDESEHLIAFHNNFCSIVTFSDVSLNVQKISLPTESGEILEVAQSGRNQIFALKIIRDEQIYHRTLRVYAIDGEFFISDPEKLSSEVSKDIKIVDFDPKINRFAIIENKSFYVTSWGSANQKIDIAKIMNNNSKIISMKLTDHGHKLIILTKDDKELMVEMIDIDKQTLTYQSKLAIPENLNISDSEIQIFPELEKILITLNTSNDSNVNLNKVFVFTKPRK